MGKKDPTTDARETWQPDAEWVIDDDDTTGDMTYFVQDFDPTAKPAPPREAESKPPPPAPKKKPVKPAGPGFIGTIPNRKKIRNGRFYCTNCQMECSYTMYAVKESAQIAGFPLFPLRTLTTYVECHSCASTFEEKVLAPEARGLGVEPLHLFAAKRVMILMMMADGVIDENEIRTIGEVYEAIGGRRMSETKIRTEIMNAQADGRPVEQFLDAICLNLNERGKLAVFRGAYAVAAADGEFQEEEQDFMQMLIWALRMKDDPYRTLGLDRMQ